MYTYYLATGNEITLEEGAGGARPKELKGILAVKLKTKKKKKLSAIPEIHPDMPPKKKNIIFDFSEEVRIKQSLCLKCSNSSVTSNSYCKCKVESILNFSSFKLIRFIKHVWKPSQEDHFSSKSIKYYEDIAHTQICCFSQSPNIKRLPSHVFVSLVYSCWNINRTQRKKVKLTRSQKNSVLTSTL